METRGRIAGAGDEAGDTEKKRRDQPFDLHAQHRPVVPEREVILASLPRCLRFNARMSQPAGRTRLRHARRDPHHASFAANFQIGGPHTCPGLLRYRSRRSVGMVGRLTLACLPVVLATGALLLGLRCLRGVGRLAVLRSPVPGRVRSILGLMAAAGPAVVPVGRGRLLRCAHDVIGLAVAAMSCATGLIVRFDQSGALP